jgi:hypothetical protein
MGIARPPENSPKKVIQSLNGVNIDQWQSININNFVPQALQQVLDAINTLVDSIKAVIELGLEIAKILAAITSELFDLLKAIITGLADAIKSLLDLLPLLDSAVYLLWVPTEFGGVNYYTRTYKNSLIDPNDFMKPPSDPRMRINAMFFMWGAPWFNEEKKRQAREASAAFKRLFSLQGKSEESFSIPAPADFTIEKGSFAKPKGSTSVVTNTITVPRKTIEEGATLSKIRTTIKKISRKSEDKGISHNIRWRVPSQYGATSRLATTYTKKFKANNDGTESHIFRKYESRLIGIDIVRGERYEDVEAAKVAMKSPTQNPYSHQLRGDYEDKEESFVKNTTLIHQSLSSFPGTDYYIDLAPDTQNKAYYYAASYVYVDNITEVYVTVQANKKVTVDRVVQTDIANSRTTLAEPKEDTLDEVDFANVDPKKIKYPRAFPDDYPAAVGPATSTIAVATTKITAPSGGAQPDWISYSLMGDLLPEIQRFIDQSKNLVDTIVKSILDDAEALEDWIQTKIRELEDILNEANELTNLLEGLLFPALAGVNYLEINSKNGVEEVTQRYERTLQYGLGVNSGAYDPLLLDNGFQEKYPDEYNKRVHIPAYDENHLVGGFILMFQEPSVGNFIRSFLEIGENFEEQFQRLVNDTRLRLGNIRIPELREIAQPTHPFVELEEYNNPDDFMIEKSKYTGGQDGDDAETNEEGNAEIKSDPGPFENLGEPLDLSFYVEEDGICVWKKTTLPKGNLTASQVVALMNAEGANASVVDDGSIVMEGKCVGCSPCSEKAAKLLGLSIGAVEVSVTFVNNGRAPLEMREATPPIFQLRKFNETLLGPDTHNIKIHVEGDEQIVDVTGNAGTNPRDKSPTWLYNATFPLTVETAQYITTTASGDLALTGIEPLDVYLFGTATGFTVSLPSTDIAGLYKRYTIFNSSTETVTLRYYDTTVFDTIAPNTTIQVYLDNRDTVNGEWIILPQDNPTTLVGNDQFTFQISGTPVSNNGISEDPVTLTLRPATYNNVHALSSEILRLLIDEGYPIGLFSTTSNEASTEATFFLTELWAQTADVTLSITPTAQRDFLATLDTSTVSPGTYNQPYTAQEVVDNLNAVFAAEPFSNENGSIRITGQTEGPSSQIKVFTSVANQEYALVSQALFGFRQLQVQDTEVRGIGVKRLSNEYLVDIYNQDIFCIELVENAEERPTLYTEILNQEYNVEIVNSQELEYTIEFVKQT